MDQKAIRMSAEHTRGYGRDCMHLVYSLLALLDDDVTSSRQTLVHGQLDRIAERLSRVAEELFSIRRELVEIRYTPEIDERLNSTLRADLQELRDLDECIDWLVGRTALLLRAQRVTQRTSHPILNFKAPIEVAQIHVRSALEVSRLESDELSKAVWDALTALRSAHSNISFEEADAIEHRRWRE